MNLLTVTEEELVADLEAKVQAHHIAKLEMDAAADRIYERRRLVALQSQFGNITEQDIQAIRDAQVLQASSITSEEKVKLN